MELASPSLNSSDWTTLEPAGAAAMAEVADQVHHAAQLVVTASTFLCEKQPDDSHTNLEWLFDQRTMAGWPIPGHQPFRMAIKPEELILCAVDEAGNDLATFSMNGRTKVEGFTWMQKTIAELGGNRDALQMEMHYEIPVHGTDLGDPFLIGNPDYFKGWTDLRDNGERLLAKWAEQLEGHHEVRTWPHHFDTGFYAQLKFDDAGNNTLGIGVGLAIHDDYCNDNYFYVNHYSKEPLTYPDPLPPITGGGRWNTQDWTGAILSVSDLTGSGGAQQEQANAFLESALQATTKIVGL